MRIVTPLRYRFLLVLCLVDLVSEFKSSDIMDLNSSSKNNTDAKVVFRKPSNDTANRKYRRHSPASGSSSYSESPEREQSKSPIHPRKREVKALDDKHRNDVRRESEREIRRNPSSKDRDTHRHNKHDDHSKHHKHGDEDDHDKYRRLSSRSGWESRSSRNSDGRRRETEYNNKYKEHEREDSNEIYHYHDHTKQRSMDRKKYKDKDLPHSRVSSSNVESRFNESRKHKNEYSMGHRDDHKESDGRKHAKDYKKTDREESNGDKFQFRKDISSRIDDRSTENDRSEAYVKNSKPSVTDHGEDSRNVNDGQDIGSSIFNDVNAAKVAAMKAAELVNRNISGVGVLSTEQKKKLLWGNKNTTTVESSNHGWENALFSDRERQEKFNKLMSLRLHWWLWPIVGSEGGPKNRGLYCPLCRKTQGASARPRETVHRRAKTQRRSHRRSRSLVVLVVFSLFLLLFLLMIQTCCQYLGFCSSFLYETCFCDFGWFCWLVL